MNSQTFAIRKFKSAELLNQWGKPRNKFQFIVIFVPKSKPVT